MLIIAHRGASEHLPENSLAAFRAAVELGADGVELDVHCTADGAFVVYHDDSVCGARVDQSSLNTLRDFQLPNGEPIPTLSESLEVLGSETKVFVEVKSLDATQDSGLLQVLHDGPNPSFYHVHSFDHRIVRRLLNHDAGLVGGVLSASYPVNPLIQLEQSGAMELWQRENLVDDELVAAVHAIGRRIIPWTVDDAARIEELMDMGVDGMCSNRPDLVRRLLS